MLATVGPQSYAVAAVVVTHLAARCVSECVVIGADRSVTAFQKLLSLGQRIAVDISVRKEVTGDKKSVVFVARDEVTGYVRAYPLAARNADNVVGSLLSFLAKHTAGPCVMCKSD